MPPNECEKCGSPLNKNASSCPACGTPVLFDNLNPLSQNPGPRKRRTVGLLIAALLAGLLIATWISIRKNDAPVAPVVSPINLDDLRARAERGDAQAQQELGVAFAKGHGVPQSYAEAAKWYRLAADQGHAAAENALGELYEAGQGVRSDASQAAAWYRRAADQGNASGEYNLAVLYVIGKGVPQNDVEALVWYRRSAGHGNPLAQFNLGMRYKEGRGVVHDPLEAYAWLSLAANKGIADATKARDELKHKMTSAQVAEAKRRAESFTAASPVSPPK